MGRRYIERLFMAGTKVGYSSICLIFKFKVGRSQRILCVKDSRPQIEHDTKDHSAPPAAKRNREQWQLKSDASVYSGCLKPLFALPTLIALIIWTGVLPVARHCAAGLGDSLAGFSQVAAAENKPCHLMNPALIQMERVCLAS